MGIIRERPGPQPRPIVVDALGNHFVYAVRHPAGWLGHELGPLSQNITVQRERS